MVGPLFTVSTINVARAAIRKAEHGLSLETPVEVKVGAHDPSKPSNLHVRVSNPAGQAYEIDVSEAVVDVCLLREEPLDANVLIDQLAAEIRAAICRALGLHSTLS